MRGMLHGRLFSLNGLVRAAALDPHHKAPARGGRLKGGCCSCSALFRGCEIGISLHAMFADVEAFGFFGFADANATENGADD